MDRLSLENLPSLRHFSLDFHQLKIDSTIESKLFDKLPSIQHLCLTGRFSHFNLDSLVNLKSLSLTGQPNKDFNFDLFKNICNKLVVLRINLMDIDNKFIDTMFFDHSFSILTSLSISSSKSIIDKIEKEFFFAFPMLQSLIICNKFPYLAPSSSIDPEAFSNLKQLISLDLSGNGINSLKRSCFSGLDKLKYLNLSQNRFESIGENVFSSLKNLRVLDLSENKMDELNANSFEGLSNLQFLDLKENKLKIFDLRILDYIGQIKSIDLSKNTIDNKEEILNRSNVKFIF